MAAYEDTVISILAKDNNLILEPSNFKITGIKYVGDVVTFNLTGGLSSRYNDTPLVITHTKDDIDTLLKAVPNVEIIPTSTQLTLYDLLETINNKYSLHLTENDIDDVLLPIINPWDKLVEIDITTKTTSLLYVGTSKLLLGPRNELKVSNISDSVLLHVYKTGSNTYNDIISRLDTIQSTLDDTFIFMSNASNINNVNIRKVVNLKSKLVVFGTFDMDIVINNVITNLNDDYILYLDRSGLITGFFIDTVALTYPNFVSDPNSDTFYRYKIDLIHPTDRVTFLQYTSSPGVSVTYNFVLTEELTHIILDDGYFYIAFKETTDGVSDVINIKKYKEDSTLDNTFTLTLRSKDNNTSPYVTPLSIKDMYVTDSFLDILLDTTEISSNITRKPIINEEVYVDVVSTATYGSWVPIVRVIKATGSVDNVFDPKLTYMAPGKMFMSGGINTLSNYIVSTDDIIYFINYTKSCINGLDGLHIMVINKRGNVIIPNNKVINDFIWQQIYSMTLITEDRLVISGRGKALTNLEYGVVNTLTAVLDKTNQYQYKTYVLLNNSIIETITENKS